MVQKLFFSLILIGLSGLLVQCAMIHSSSVSDISAGSGFRVKAQDTGFGFLMLTIPSLDVAAKLKAQCAGHVTGVQTVTSHRNFALIQIYQQEAIGWCQNI